MLTENTQPKPRLAGPVVRVRVHDFKTGDLIQELETDDYPAPGTRWSEAPDRIVVGIEFLRDECPECLCVRIWVR